jgi:hypothetical protein
MWVLSKKKFLWLKYGYSRRFVKIFQFPYKQEKKTKHASKIARRLSNGSLAGRQNACYL